MVYLDTAAKFDKLDDTNTGFKNRKIKFSHSSVCMLYFPVETEVLMQDKLILPNVNVQITLNPSQNAFRIMSGELVAERSQKLVIGKRLCNLFHNSREIFCVFF